MNEASGSSEITPGTLLSFEEKVLAKDRAVLERNFRAHVATFISWMEHPYSKSLAAAVFGVAIYQSIFGQVLDTQTNFIKGFTFAICVYLLVCSWQLRDSLLVRPHPVFWRIVKGLSFLYFFGLVWLIFQNVSDARYYLSLWDPSLGIPLAEKSYAGNCTIFTPDDPVSYFRNVHDALLDEHGNFDTFIVCHLLGWFCKMLMIRDLRLTLIASVLFEIYEISLVHWLPNFAECWWDSLVLDIILCNGLGIICGYYFLRFFKCTEYNFLYDCNVTIYVDGREKVVRKWKPLVSFRYLLGPLIVLIGLAAIELNAFFLKYVMWVPPPHSLNFWRVIFWWLLGCAGVREWYYWVENDNAPIGMMFSLICLNATFESLISYKFGTGLFPTPTPFFVKLAWGSVLGSIALFAALYYPFNSAFRRDAKCEVERSDAEGAAPPRVKAD